MHPDKPQPEPAERSAHRRLIGAPETDDPREYLAEMVRQATEETMIAICRLCPTSSPFQTPTDDLIGQALMREHLDTEHPIRRVLVEVLNGQPIYGYQRATTRDTP